jgi:hypothetical protein
VLRKSDRRLNFEFPVNQFTFMAEQEESIEPDFDEAANDSGERYSLVSVFCAMVAIGGLAFLVAHSVQIPRPLSTVLNAAGYALVQPVFFLLWHLYRRLLTPCYSQRRDTDEDSQIDPPGEAAHLAADVARAIV